MGNIVQARLDAKAQATLDRVASRLGWSTSKVLREGIHLVEERHNASPVRRLIGIGMFGGGPADLSTNKKYLEDFGLKGTGRVKRPAVRKKAR